MYRVALILKAVWSYNGDCTIENPNNSTFWKQSFIQKFKDDLPNGRKWRFFTIDLCRTGCKFKKATKMMTTLKAEHTSHMGLRCNHPLGHKRCALGGAATLAPRTPAKLPPTRTTSAP